VKKLLVTALLCGLPLTVGAEMEQYKAEAKKITGEFFTELKGELGKGMKAGGPVAAVGVCNTRAPEIAATYSAQTGWDVGRTSLKLRNPANAPDAWEAEVLRQFEERRAKGEAPDTLAYAEIVDEGGERHFRFMKGIVMPPADKMPCLKCHGENIDPATIAVLDQFYPQDEARGYKAGQLRGAFTLKKKL